MKRLTLLSAALLAFSILYGPLALFAPAARADADSAIPSEESGWVLVSTADELIHINRNQASYLDRNIRLTKDIDMTGYEWIPFGGNDSAAFSGIFDGRGHRIGGVSIDGSGLYYVGFFGVVTGAVQDLSVSIQASGGSYTGGLAGHLDGGTITRSSTHGVVTGGAGSSAEPSVVGGIAGAANKDSTITRSYSSVDVRSGPAGNQYAGGLIGSQGAGAISDAYATGTVTNSAGLYFTAGGLAGQLIYGTIQNSYATGEVSATENSPHQQMGGFVGIIGGNASIIASYFDNVATLQTNGAGSRTENGEFQLTGRATAEMKSEANYGEPDYAWNFAEIWAIRPGVNEGYPYLRPFILTSGLPRAVKDVPYTQALEAFDGAGGGLDWGASGLPAGLQMTSSGALEGVPAESGAFAVTVTATDAGLTSASSVMTLYVDEEAPDIVGFGIGPGGAFGSTRVTAASGDPDRAFAYLLGDTAGARPLAGTSPPDEAVSYSLGSDIYPVSLGQILQIYETDGNRRVTAWSSIRIEAHHLQDQAPPTVGTVTGTVYGAGNAPLSGATVSAGGIVEPTNGEGKFALHRVAEGVHTLSVSARGYQAYSTTVNVVAGTTADAGRIVMRIANASGPSNGSNPAQGSPPQPPAPNETTLKINGKDVLVPFAKERENDGRSVIRLKLEADLLRSLFGAGGEVVIDFDNEDPVVKADIPAETLQDLAKDRPDAVIRIGVNGAGYSLPLRIWEGVPKDATVTVAIARTTAAARGELKDALARKGHAMLAEPADFSLYIDGVPWTEAGGAYTERTLSLDAAAQSGRSTIVRVDAAGRLHFVPSVFGKEIATFYTSHHGLFAAIRSDRSFADMTGHWARADIELLANKLVVEGTSPHTFDPDRTVTRAEFTAMLVRALGLVEQPDRAAFADVRPEDAWYAGAAGAASEAGLIVGYDDGTFRPNALVTREQTVAMLARAIRYAGELPQSDVTALERFYDHDEVAGWAKESAAQLTAAGIVEGVGDAAFAPKELATRAQSAVLLTRMLRYLKFVD